MLSFNMVNAEAYRHPDAHCPDFGKVMKTIAIQHQNGIPIQETIRKTLPFMSPENRDEIIGFIVEAYKLPIGIEYAYKQSIVNAFEAEMVNNCRLRAYGIRQQ